MKSSRFFITSVIINWFTSLNVAFKMYILWFYYNVFKKNQIFTDLPLIQHLRKSSYASYVINISFIWAVRKWNLKISIILEYYDNYQKKPFWRQGGYLMFSWQLFVTVISESLSMNCHCTFSCNVFNHKPSWRTIMPFLV